MPSERIRIQGGVPLKGEVHICGGKNAALAVLPAALLTDDVCVIDNLPSIDDIPIMADLLRAAGAKVSLRNRVMTIDASGVDHFETPKDLAGRVRGSTYFMGAFLGRVGHGRVAIPGGCQIGARKLDFHFKGFGALGATVTEEGDFIGLSSNGGLIGNEIYLDFPSVGATINLMLASVKAKGNTIIANAAKEPHIVELASMLNGMGAHLRGAGTDTIRVRGVEKLHGCSYSIIPDQIETGTLMIAAAATRGDVIIHGAIPVHLEALSAKLLEMGVHVYEQDDMIRVACDGPYRACHVTTQPYPGFPTDLQQPLSAMLACAMGTSTINETIFEDRQRHIAELCKMGAVANVENKALATIQGVDHLTGTTVFATDLRAGAAMVIAGLMAQGETLIGNVHYIDRGYESLETKLRSLGARISRITVDE